MNTCKTFQFFNPEPESDGYGDCSRWHRGYTIPSVEVGRNEVLVEDDEGWAMTMGPDFGCVLHEEKDQ